MDKQFITVLDANGNTHIINKNMIVAISPWGTNQQIILLAATQTYPGISTPPIIINGGFHLR